MGIRRGATVEEAVMNVRRRRRHRADILNEIEADITELKENLCPSTEDRSMWRRGSGYKTSFSTNETWRILRVNYTQCSWSRSVWFPQATPKFLFIVWLAMLNRLSTMDRISSWSRGVDETCVLCKCAPETKNHLFFGCSFSSQLWEYLVKGILGSAYTNDWNAVVLLITDQSMERKKLFCIRYAFQAAVHALWRERNKIKHDDKPLPLPVLQKLVEKGVRNKLSLMRIKGGKGMQRVLQYWFGARL
ncbi:PREDICTED: uncharacterized protein LOC106338914 [Brassica oleracea var. oleracea]|uniref:uncharacterized protein LOC106338914 n=1 Tax=Brassica oleracea var. oleracea TaxID=109376 RepID=UPI0006A7354E|nr:PREDICTED: uncharacterized protein LOC106338914 [Brassica oleracea var. oleracea]